MPFYFEDNYLISQEKWYHSEITAIFVGDNTMKSLKIFFSFSWYFNLLKSLNNFLLTEQTQ